MCGFSRAGSSPSCDLRATVRRGNSISPEDLYSAAAEGVLCSAPSHRGAVATSKYFCGRSHDQLAVKIPARTRIKNSPNTLTKLSIVCKNLFPELTDWHQVPEEWFGPRKSGHYTNELAGDSGNFRNRYIFRLLVDRVRRGDRVLAVIGSSHVVVARTRVDKGIWLAVAKGEWTNTNCPLKGQPIRSVARHSQ